MAITYTEFDTTPAGLIAALKAAILTNADWSAIAVTPVSTTTSGATTSTGTTVTVTSATGFTVGQWITIGTSPETYRQITAIAGSTITVSAQWGAVYSSGSVFKTRNNIVTAVTDRGAEIFLDLEAGGDNASFLGVALHRDWTGTVPGGHVDTKNFYTYYRFSAGTSTMPLHVILSLSKNHLFFSIEGPRAWETSPTSTTYGSIRNYFAVCDLVPYHAADTTPCVVAIGMTTNSPVPTVTNSAHQVSISRNTLDTLSWQPGRLATLDWPTIYTTDVVTPNRDCTIDGKTYLLPYVMFSEVQGLRGRLSDFFYCGTTAPSPVTDLAEPVGTRVEFDGAEYKLLAVNKGDGSNVAWGPFGSIDNDSSPTRSLVLAVPYADVV
jgi:hypothetical protein